MEGKRLWELLARRFDGQITEEELRELQELLKEGQENPPYLDVLAELRSMSARVSGDDMAAKARSLSAIMQSVQTPRPPKRKKWLALTVLGMAIAASAFFFHRTSMTAGSSAETYDRIVTKPGSKTLINLPDSSTVVLNSACQFAYNKDFGVKKREMQLTGEAWFDVHSNPDMPLVVHAGNAIIRVLGTAFNVKAYAEDGFVEATLVRGVIEVSLRSDPDRKILLRPNEKILIRDQSAEIIKTSDSLRSKPHDEVIRVTHVDADPKDSSYIETAWLKDKLAFRKETFASLARRMERWYQVHIVFTDTVQESLLFTGSFEKETVTEALEALRHSAPFSYDINGRTITIQSKER